MKISNRLIILSIIYLLFIPGYGFGLGHYLIGGVFVLVFIFFYLLIIFLDPLKINHRQNLTSFWLILEMILVLSIIFSTFSPMASYLQSNSLSNLIRGMQYLAIIISISRFFINKHILLFGRSFNITFLLLFFLAILMRVVLISASPDPKIGVFDILKYGGLGMLNGQNPYSITYPQLYPNVVPNYFTYWPVSFLSVAIFVKFFNDPRYTFVLAEFLSALLIYLIIKKINVNRQSLEKIQIERTAQSLSLIFLFNPLSLFILDKAWLDPLMTLLLLVFAYFFYFYPTKLFALVAFGLFLAVKQYALFMLLFLIKLKNFRIQHYIVPISTLLVMIVPFLIWNQQDFISDTILEPINRKPRYDSRTVSSLLFNSFRVTYPLIISWVIALPILLLSFIKINKTLSSFFFGSAIFYLGFFLFFREAFLNHYYFVGQLILISITLYLYEIGTRKKHED